MHLSKGFREIFFDEIKNIISFFSFDEIICFINLSQNVISGRCTLLYQTCPKKPRKHSPGTGLSQGFFFEKKRFFKKKNHETDFRSRIIVKKLFNELQIEVKLESEFIYTLSSPFGKNFLFDFFDFGVSFSKEKFTSGIIKFFKNRIEYFPCYNGILIDILRIFPYFLKKRVKILTGFNNIFNFQFHFLVFSVLSGKNLLSFWIISKSQTKLKNLHFKQVGKLNSNKLPLLIWNSFYFKSGILIATASSTELGIFRFTLKKLSTQHKTEYWGQSRDILEMPISSLIWENTFYPCLFTTSFNGNILIWNEILFPLFKVSRLQINCLFMQDFPKFPLFVLGFKKNFNSKKDLKIQKSLRYSPRTFLETFSLRKRSGQKEHLKLSKLNLLLDNNSVIFKNEIKLLIKKFLTIKTSSSLNRFLLAFCHHFKKKKPGKFTVESFGGALTDYFSSEILYQKNYFFSSHKNFTFCLKVIGKARRLSVEELEIYQRITKKKNLYYFQQCEVCRRLLKIQTDIQKNINYCPFFHFCHSSLEFGPSCTVLRTPHFEEEVRQNFKKKFFFSIHPKKISRRNIKNFLFFQKDYHGLCRGNFKFKNK